MTRKPEPLTPGTTKRLLAYAAVAGAAAFLGPTGADAEVIYTPTHAKINHHFSLDLNNDGVIDFRLSSYYAYTEGKVEVYPVAQGNRIVATPQRCQGLPVAAAPLRSGQIIGPARNFLNSANCMVVDDTGLASGPWYHVKNRYLGFAFVIDGQEHFGWARLSIDYLPALNNEVLGYAYETVPNKPIIAGDQGNSTEASTQQESLGALAAGAPALNLSRRQEEKATVTSRK